MKILIGTPIHQVKDYCMERWLENVSKLEYPADLFMVDNSPGAGYVEKIKGYCTKYGIHPVRSMAFESDIESNVDIDLSTPPKHEYQTSNGARNYKIEHLEIDQALDPEIRIERSQEIIRQEILSHDYEAWFSWECDQIIPTNALDTLIRIMESGNFMMVVHNSWDRHRPVVFNTDMGCTLVKRECLEKHGFLPKRGLGRWKGGKAWFKERVFREGGNYIDVYGLITPIYHLSK